MAVYGYCRVSTARQASEGESLDVQQRQIDGYAIMHGFGISETVIEEGVSGSVPVTERPAGGALFSRLQKGDIIIASKLDRLFRSALDALKTVEELKAKGVSLHLLDLGGDISGNGLSRLFLTVASAFAEAERDRIAERISQVKADQRTRNRFLGGPRPPFGWRVGENDSLVEDLAEQRAISKIYALRADGLSLRAISEALAEDGIAISHVTVGGVISRASEPEPAATRTKPVEAVEEPEPDAGTIMGALRRARRLRQ